MIFRLSQKIAKKIKAPKLSEMPLDENPFADWSSHLFTAGRMQYIILSNTKSLYSCVMPGKGVTNARSFVDPALGAIREFMEEDGESAVYERFIEPSSSEVTFAKALNRSVTGSLNELVMAAEHSLSDREENLYKVGYYLNDFLLSAIATELGGYGRPKDAFTRLVEEQGSR